MESTLNKIKNWFKKKPKNISQKLNNQLIGQLYSKLHNHIDPKLNFQLGFKLRNQLRDNPNTKLTYQLNSQLIPFELDHLNFQSKNHNEK